MSKFESHLLYEEYNFEDDSRLARREKSKNGRLQHNNTPQASDVADLIGLEGGLDISYQPSRHESGWLIDSLRSFFDLELISDVQALIKGGKEANVYRCAAHEATGERWLAAKVYRPRMFRNLRNDKQYRQGRVTLTTNGRPLDGSDTRAIRAMGKKTAFGQQLAHTSWLMHEYTTLELLHEVGANVPRPIAAATNAILMSFVGDQYLAAPTLNEISLEPLEAERVFGVVMENIGLMLGNGRIHGDLSAYNILYWQGNVVLIDFPQVSNSEVDSGVHELGSRMNPDAYNILGRDVERICDYFSRFGVNCDPSLLTHNLWQRHTHFSQRNQLADASLLLED